MFSAPTVEYDRDGKPTSFWGLKGAASLNNKSLFLTVVNPSVKDARETEIVFRGATAKSGTATVLTNPDIHAHNTFEQRDVVTPRRASLKVGNPLVFTFPPASVTALQIDLS